MYLNRRIFLLCKCVSAFGFGLFGYISCLMTLGLIMDIVKGEGIYLNEAIVKPYIIILYSHVLAKAISVQEKNVANDLHFLEKMLLCKKRSG